MNSNILISGSVAFDDIFDINSPIQNNIHVENNQISSINLMFVANSKKRFLGGTGGNIAYGIAKLGITPTLFSLAGSNFEKYYGNTLEKNNIKSKIIIDKDKFTATFYSITDPTYQQIGIWQPNVFSNIANYKLTHTLTKSELKNISIACFSPGTNKSILLHMKNLREVNKNATIIFDPGQILSNLFSKQDVLDAISLSSIIIINTNEKLFLENNLKIRIKDITHTDKVFIETKAENGCTIYTKENQVNTPPYKKIKPKDPTGAGDAFRSGFIYGLEKNYSLPKSAEIGSYLAFEKIQTIGGQNYEISNSNIKKIINLKK